VSWRFAYGFQTDLHFADVLTTQRAMSRPQNDVTEGIMMLAEDWRPERTLLIGFS